MINSVSNVGKEPHRGLSSGWSVDRRLWSLQIHELGQKVSCSPSSDGCRKLQVKHAPQALDVRVRLMALHDRRHDGGNEACDLRPPRSVALKGCRKKTNARWRVRQILGCLLSLPLGGRPSVSSRCPHEDTWCRGVADGDVHQNLPSSFGQH